MSKTKVFSKSVAVILAIMLCLTAFLAAPVSAATTGDSYSVSFTDDNYKDDNRVVATVAINMDSAAKYNGVIIVDSTLSFSASDISAVSPSVNVYLQTNAGKKAIFIESTAAVTDLSFTITFNVDGVAPNYYEISLGNYQITNSDTEEIITLTAGATSATVAVGDPNYLLKGFMTQVKAVEPWGIRFSSRFQSQFSTNDPVDVTASAWNDLYDYGAYILVKEPGEDASDVDSMTVDQLAASARKFSKLDANSKVEITTHSGGATGITVTYDEAIYTYQMKDKRMYVVFYIQKTSGDSVELFGTNGTTEYYKTPRTLYTALENNLASTSNQKLKDLINAMVALYEKTVAYRSTLG